MSFLGPPKRRLLANCSQKSTQCCISFEETKDQPNYVVGIFAYLGTKIGNRIVMEFCTEVEVLAIITRANFGDYRFRRCGDKRRMNFSFFQ